MEKEKSKALRILEKETSRRAFLKGTLVTAGGMAALATAGPIRLPQAKAAEPGRKPLYKHLFVERDNCTGCRACEYACSLKHEGTIRPSVSMIWVRRYHSAIDVPIICWNCEDAPCIKACPTTPVAITKDPKTGAVKFIDDKTCLGAKCNKCVEACPAGYLRRHPDTGWPIFCDMCDGDPECVKACEQQSGHPQGPCLRAGRLGFGVNMAYRAVTPDEAAKDLHTKLLYPNKEGERR